jgi:predicted nucleic acid-binding Zn ribbon protein
MEPLSTTARFSLRHILDGQPVTAAKVSFAWTIAAGPALARATEHEWRPDGVFVVRARTDAWVKELRRARPLLTERLTDLLGPGTVKQFVIE